MGLYDREYTQADFQSRRHYGPQMRLNFPKLTPVVKWLLIANITIYVLSVLTPLGKYIYDWFQIDTASTGRFFQLWRLISYQFLHSSNYIFHIVFNMVGLYFLGPTLERHWGSKKFLIFYLGCGIAGGLFYMLLVAVGFLPNNPMVGASGSILGMLAACAILFPQFVVFFFIFPVPIRIATVVLTFVYFLIVITRGDNAGGNACHLAGMAAGAGYVLSGPWRSKLNIKKTAGQRWEKKMTEKRNLQIELDRILDKVHRSGIHSLTSKEKRTLRKATKAEQMRNRF